MHTASTYNFTDVQFCMQVKFYYKSIIKNHCKKNDFTGNRVKLYFNQSLKFYVYKNTESGLICVYM